MRRLVFRMGGAARSRQDTVFLLAVCGLCVVAFLAIGIASVAQPFDLDIYEGCIFLPATRMAEGLPVYGQAVATNPPFVFTNYGPVYYAFVAQAVRHVGLAFWPGRLLSLASVLTTALLLGYVVRREQTSYVAGAVAGVLYLMMPATWTFGSIQRVDALGVCFAVLAIAAAVHGAAGWPQQRFSAFLLAGVAASLAVLTKQSLLAVGIAIFFSLLFAGRGIAIGCFLAGGAAVLGAFALWTWLTGNTGYFFNQAANAAVPFTLRQLVLQVRLFTQSGTVIAGVVLAALTVPTGISRGSRLAVRLAALYLVVAALTAGVSASRIASSTNHFLELGAAIALCAGLAFARLRTASGDGRRLANVLLCIALLVDLALFRVAFVRGRILIPDAKRPFHERLARDLTALVPAGEPLIGEYTDAAIRSGRPVYFSDLGMYQVGPPYLSGLLADYIARRRVAGLISAGPMSIEGYSLVPDYGYTDPGSVSGNYPGPLLYVRDDLLPHADVVIER